MENTKTVSSSSLDVICGQLRNFLKSYSRSPLYTEAQYQTLKHSFSLRLEERNLKAPPPYYDRIGFKYDMTKQQVRDLLQIETPNPIKPKPEVERLQRMLTSGADKRRQTEWAFRLGQHIELLDTLGWYPFFCTLTLDPGTLAAWDYDGQKFWQNSDEWKRFKRRCAITVGRELGLTDRASRSQESTLVQSFCVIEHGKNRDHHHAHCLIWLKAIPSEWKRDPNANNPRKNYHNCRPMCSLWPWGVATTCHYFRFSGDIWSRLGFIWPVHIKKLTPIKVHNAAKAGCYMTKYLDKEHREWLYRTKVSCNLGMHNLRKVIEVINYSMLSALALRMINYAQSLKWYAKTSVPASLIRAWSRRRKNWLLFNSEADLTTWTQPKATPFLAMCESVLNGQKLWLMLSWERFEWLQACLFQENIEFSEYFDQALDYIALVYLSDKSKPSERMFYQ